MRVTYKRGNSSSSDSWSLDTLWAGLILESTSGLASVPAEASGATVEAVEPWPGEPAAGSSLASGTKLAIPTRLGARLSLIRNGCFFSIAAPTSEAWTPRGSCGTGGASADNLTGKFPLRTSSFVQSAVCSPPSQQPTQHHIRGPPRRTKLQPGVLHFSLLRHSSFATCAKKSSAGTVNTRSCSKSYPMDAATFSRVSTVS